MQRRLKPSNVLYLLISRSLLSQVALPRFESSKKCYAGMLLVLLILTSFSVSVSDPLWGSTGHRLINLKAAMHLPASMASFKADSIFYRDHASDADNRKVSGDTAFFAEAQRHFIDIDAYPNFHSLSHNLDTVIMQYGRSTVRDIGTQPWAEVMVFDSLVAQLKRGDLADARQSMADLGHYVADAHQPLHCTANYDGQFTGNNGIHSRYETGMINTYSSNIIISPDTVQYIAHPIDYIFDFIYHSNSYTDSIMAADNYAKGASGWSSSGTVPASYYAALWLKTGDFTKDQFQRATVALASLWYTAWVNSQTLTDTITASAGPNGAITPSGVIIVIQGDPQRFTFTPSTGYYVDSVLVDGVRVDSGEGYTFSNVTTEHTISVGFKIYTYVISSQAGPHGSVSPTPSVIANYGSNQIFAFTPDSGYQIDSIYIDEVYAGSSSPDTLRNITSPHTIRGVFGVQGIVVSVEIKGRWNLVSLPLAVMNSSRSSSFPTALTDAYAYVGHYQVRANMEPGTGYWLKFGEAQSCPISGFPVNLDTIILVAGWNMIGTISSPLAVSHITSPTPGLTLSQFFGYARGYFTTDTLQPGSGYWVKASMPGQIILSNQAIVALGGIKLIAPISDLPPSPPQTGSADERIPFNFTLHQNYPNPFNPATTIDYELPDATLVLLKVYNSLGQEIATLVNGIQNAGYQSAHFEMGNLPSGVYAYQLTAGNYTAMKMMVVLK